MDIHIIDDSTHEDCQYLDTANIAVVEISADEAAMTAATFFIDRHAGHGLRVTQAGAMRAQAGEPAGPMSAAPMAFCM